MSRVGRLRLAPGGWTEAGGLASVHSPTGRGPQGSTARPFTRPLRASVSPLDGGGESTRCRPRGSVTMSLQHPRTEGPAGCPGQARGSVASPG